MRTRKLPRKLLIGAGLTLALVMPASAVADTFTVTNSSNSGPGSLRQAVLDANAHPGRDAINFDPGVHSVFLSGGGALDITDDVDLNGTGAENLELVGSGPRFFTVKALTEVTLSGMTLRFGGSAIAGGAATGGAVLNDGKLAITGVTFDGNRVSGSAGADARGGAIANSGTLSLRNSVLSNNEAETKGGGTASGGAIFNSGTMAVDGTHLTENKATGGEIGGQDGGVASGGAIANTGDLRISDSTLSGNVVLGGDASRQGGDGLGGAIYNYGSGTLNISRSTIDHNHARSVGGDVAGFALGGGIDNAGVAAFHLENVTLAGNQAEAFGGHAATQAYGGGIEDRSNQPAQSTVVATTISGNSAAKGSNISNSAALLSLQDTIVAYPDGQNCGHFGGVPSINIKSLGYNLDSDGSCELKATGDKSNKDPQLGELADNGGPTETMAVPLSSPALDQGVSGGLTTDQRGEKRPVIVPGVPRPPGGDGSDIGAYEYQPAVGGHRRIVGKVKPGRTHVGESTCFTFKAKRPSGAPMKKVQVKFAGKRARTNQRGKATICKRFDDKGTRHPRLRKRGYERARLTIKVRS